jgi:hypothetical protein
VHITRIATLFSPCVASTLCPASAARDRASKGVSGPSCSTNAIESLNARYRRAVRARGHFPTEQAAMKCLYLGHQVTGPHRARTGTMDDAVEASSQRVRSHLRRPLTGSRNLLMQTAGNTVTETHPAAQTTSCQRVSGMSVSMTTSPG